MVVVGIIVVVVVVGAVVVVAAGVVARAAVVVVVGGLGSLGGAMIASLLIGMITSLCVGIDKSLADLFSLLGMGDWAQGIGGLLTLKLSSLASTIPFALMLLVLLVRPSGLMGEKEYL